MSLIIVSSATASFRVSEMPKTAVTIARVFHVRRRRRCSSGRFLLEGGLKIDHVIESVTPSCFYFLSPSSASALAFATRANARERSGRSPIVLLPCTCTQMVSCPLRMQQPHLDAEAMHDRCQSPWPELSVVTGRSPMGSKQAAKREFPRCSTAQ